MSTITGTADGEYLAGTTGDDIIEGLGGNDTLRGHTGSDTLLGGDGNDILAPDAASYYHSGDSWHASYYWTSYDDGAADHIDGGAGADRVVLRFDTLSSDMAGDLSDSTVSVTFGNGTTVINVEEFHMVLGSGNDSIILGAGNDFVFGQNGNDTIDGGAGSDILDGGAGTDTLSGGDGRDYLFGGSDNDVLSGGGDDDQLRGDHGDDVLTGGAGTDWMQGGDGSDTVVLEGTRSDYILAAWHGNIRLTDTRDGSVDYIHSVEVLQFSDQTAPITNLGPLVIEGSSSIDWLSGSYIADVISGYGGNDRLHGFEGDDVLNGGDGDDYLDGGYGNDTLDGGAGTDRASVNLTSASAGVTFTLAEGVAVDTGNGTTTLYGIEAVNLFGSSYADTLTGGSANDQIHGGHGDDVLDGLAGDDYLDGGSGNDVLYGGAGIDQTRLHFAGTSGVTFALTDGAVANLSYGTKTLYSIESAVMYGSGYADVLTGGSGNDYIDGGHGNDTLNGGDGNDVLVGAFGNDTLNGGAGNDRLIDRAFSGDDTLNGGDGDDYLDGGYGNDTLDGGAGNDGTILAFWNSTAGVTFALTDGAVANSAYGTKTLYGIESARFFGSDHGDMITGGSGDDTIFGRSGDDTLNGGDGADHLFSDYGNDTMNGGAGTDNLYNYNDNALMTGGAGDDYLYDYNATGVTTALFSGASTDYNVSDLGGGWFSVQDMRTGGTDGTDRLYQIDQLRFTDGDFTAAELAADTTAPDAPTLDLADASDTGASHTDNITSDTTPTLQGEAEPNSTVEVYEGTTLLGSSTTDALGNWTLTVSTALSEGVHDLNAYATDEAGNTSVASLTLTVTFDTTITAPTIDLAPASDSGSSNSDDITSQTAPTITGTAEAGSSVSLYEGTTLLGVATAGTDGSWSVALAWPLGEGSHTLTATATDVAGNSATSAGLTFTIDTSIHAPTLDLAASSDTGISDSDNLTSDTTPTLEGQAEANSTVEVYQGTTLLGSTITNASGNWSLILETPLAEGTHELNSYATDAAGNVSIASLTLAVVLDASIATPTIDLDAASDSGSSNTDDVTNNNASSIGGTAEAGSTVRIYEGTTLLGTATANPLGAWSLTLAALSDGTHMLQATATDAAGNVSSDPASLSITVDTEIADPTIAQTSPTSDVMPNLDGTAEANSSVTIRDGSGNVVTTVLAGSDGNWAYEMETALMDGDYQYSATATDAAGNVSSTVFTTVSVVVEGNTINGGNGDDTLTGTDGRDTINGGNGEDTLSGGWAPDQIFGGNGIDLLRGDAGDDFIYGENGDDRLEGGDGSDWLQGGRGDDVLVGGSGYDSFAFGKSSGNDRIVDFVVGEDSFALLDETAISSLETSNDNTLVHLSNGGIVTLEEVIITDSADLFASTADVNTNSDLWLVV